MIEKEAGKLKVGERVVFSDAAQFRWDDGQTGVIHKDDMQDVSRIPVTA